MTKTQTTFNPAIRKNWDYHDGVACRLRGRQPTWAKCSVYKTKHPFDKSYGEGFWIGYYGEPAPKGAVI